MKSGFSYFRWSVGSVPILKFQNNVMRASPFICFTWLVHRGELRFIVMTGVWEPDRKNLHVYFAGPSPAPPPGHWLKMYLMMPRVFCFFFNKIKFSLACVDITVTLVASYWRDLRSISVYKQFNLNSVQPKTDDCMMVNPKMVNNHSCDI